MPLPIEGDAKRFSLFDRRKTSCFQLERILLDGSAAVVHNAFRVLIVTRGTGKLFCQDRTLVLRQYDRILIPHRVPELRLSGNLELLVAMPPE